MLLVAEVQAYLRSQYLPDSVPGQMLVGRNPAPVAAHGSA